MIIVGFPQIVKSESLQQRGPAQLYAHMVHLFNTLVK